MEVFLVKTSVGEEGKAVQRRRIGVGYGVGRLRDRYLQLKAGPSFK